jgi:hypothetical protein
MKKLTLPAMLLFAVMGAYAQQSIVSSGGEAVGKGGTSSYTMGQVVYTTESNDNYATLQGMQHAYEVFEVSKTEKLSALRMTLYPNPASDLVNLEAENAEGTLSYQLYSPTGQLLGAAKMEESNTSISMKEYAQGNYFIKVFLNDESVRTFKIIKK